MPSCPACEAGAPGVEEEHCLPICTAVAPGLCPAQALRAPPRAPGKLRVSSRRPGQRQQEGARFGQGRDISPKFTAHSGICPRSVLNDEPSSDWVNEPHLPAWSPLTKHQASLTSLLWACACGRSIPCARPGPGMRVGSRLKAVVAALAWLGGLLCKPRSPCFSNSETGLLISLASSQA